ncbi:MAG TPA: flagellar biosynthetic protein FliO [Bryobacterales bacterium]|nr:flagellar biosynthetic protein FliO [Bryobacterales bacterium]
MLTSLLSLGLVLGTLVALLWWVRRMAGRGGAMAGAGSAAGRHLRVIETVDLAPGRSLHLIELGGRGLVVASTPQSCELICELEAVPIEQPAVEDEPSWLGKLMGRPGSLLAKGMRRT